MFLHKWNCSCSRWHFTVPLYHGPVISRSRNTTVPYYRFGTLTFLDRFLQGWNYSLSIFSMPFQVDIDFYRFPWSGPVICRGRNVSGPPSGPWYLKGSYLYNFGSLLPLNDRKYIQNLIPLKYRRKNLCTVAQFLLLRIEARSRDNHAEVVLTTPLSYLAIVRNGKVDI